MANHRTRSLNNDEGWKPKAAHVLLLLSEFIIVDAVLPCFVQDEKVWPAYIRLIVTITTKSMPLGEEKE
jgi:hypothetical protein